MAEKATVDIDVNVGEGAKSLRTLKQEFKDIQKELDGLAVGTDEYRKKLQQLADVKDEIEDLNESIRAQTGAGKFEAIAKLGGAIAGGFAAAQGAMALFGSESKDVEKALLKVQSAMALAQGLKDLEGLGDAYNNLKTVGVNAFKAIKAAIGATGIGLLVVALAAIVSYWDDIKAAIGGVSSEQEKLNEKAKANVAAQQAKLDAIGGQENILKLQGKSEKDILKLKMSQLDAVIKATEAQIEQSDITAKAQVAAAERNRNILKGILDFIAIPIHILLKQIDFIGKAVGQDFGLSEGFSKLLEQGANLIFDPEETKKEAEKTRAEALKNLDKLKNDRAGLQLQLQEIDKQAAQKGADANKKKLDAELELQKKIRDARTETIADEEKKALEQLANQLADEKKAVQQSEATKETKNALLIALEEKYQKEVTDIQNKFAEERKKKEEEDRKKAEEERKKAEEERIKSGLLAIDAEELEKRNKKELSLQNEIDFENRRFELLRSNTQLTNEELAKLEQEHIAKINVLKDQQAKLDEERAARNKQFAIDSAQETLQTLQSLTSAFSGKSEAAQRRAFEINKAAQIAETIIATYSAAQKAYASQLIPGDPTSPIRATIAAGLSIASGLARLKQIKDTKFESKSASGANGGANGGATGTTAPAMGQTVGNTTTNIENLQNQNNQTQQPVKAVVVQTEMANVNQQVNRIEERSKIN